MNPVRRLIRRLKPIEVGNQLVTERRRFLGAQVGFCRTGRGTLRTLLALTAGLSFVGTRSVG